MTEEMGKTLADPWYRRHYDRIQLALEKRKEEERQIKKEKAKQF